jgi:hypothetical protein
VTLKPPNPNSFKTALLNPRRRRDSGHLLLAILLMVALMTIALTYEAPRIVQQLKRDREEEMIHRGTEYARAVKKFYKKFGRYPTSLEQLENTNNIRFLRKRYKDPLTKDGKWTLLHYTDVASLLVGAGGPGTPAAALGGQGLQTPGSSNSPFGSSSPATPGGLGTSSLGGAQAGAGSQGSTFSLSAQQSQLGAGQQTTSGSSLGSGLGGASAPGSTSAGSSSTPTGSSSDTGSSSGSGAGDSSSSSTTAFGSQNSANQTFGAGAIIGVASKSKDPTIRIYNKKKTYNEWVFIYNPIMDQANVLLKGPYSPSAFTSNIGTPAGQMNQQNQQQSPFGQQNPGAQQPSGFGNQTLTPGGQQFPPDQNH